MAVIDNDCGRNASSPVLKDPINSCILVYWWMRGSRERKRSNFWKATSLWLLCPLIILTLKREILISFKNAKLPLKLMIQREPLQSPEELPRFQVQAAEPAVVFEHIFLPLVTFITLNVKTTIS